jgi:protease-4
MSPESRESIQTIADALWRSWIADVRKGRPKAQLPAFAVNMPAFVERAGGDMAKAALAAGLVDKLGDRTAFGNRLAEIVKPADREIPGTFRTISYDGWIEANEPGTSGGQIGVLTVAGTIVDGKGAGGSAAAETITELLGKGLSERNLKALVVRIDSPGGSVFASERIRQAVLSAKAKGLPVVVSMGSVAASGGYWIATAADHVMAEPATITGSIGVFGVLPSFEGSLEKLGLGADGIKTTPLSGEPDLLRGPSPEADALIQGSVDEHYRRFLALVAASRKLPPARVAEIAQGRVWDGGSARQLGLVDQFGSLDEAIAEAARRAGLDPDEAEPAWLDRELGFWESLFGGFASDGSEAAGRDVFGRIAARSQLTITHALADAQQLLAAPGVQARCLQCPPVAPARLTRKEKSGLESLVSMLMQ